MLPRCLPVDFALDLRGGPAKHEHEETEARYDGNELKERVEKHTHGGAHVDFVFSGSLQQLPK